MISFLSFFYIKNVRFASVFLRPQAIFRDQSQSLATAPYFVKSGNVANRSRSKPLQNWLMGKSQAAPCVLVNYTSTDADFRHTTPPVCRKNAVCRCCLQSFHPGKTLFLPASFQGSRTPGTLLNTNQSSVSACCMRLFVN